MEIRVLMAWVTASGRLDSFPFRFLLLLLHFMKDMVFKQHCIHFNFYLQQSICNLLGSQRLLLKLGSDGNLMFLLDSANFVDKFLKFLQLVNGILLMVLSFLFLSLQIFLQVSQISSHGRPCMFWAVVMAFFIGIHSFERRVNFYEHRLIFSRPFSFSS